MDKHPIGPVLLHYGAPSVPHRTSWTQMKCPFHQDRHASASVSIDENAFICFGCGIKGDTYNIIMEQEGVDFVEAIKRAETITGTSIPSLRSKHSSSGRVLGKARAVARGREKRSFRSCG